MANSFFKKIPFRKIKRIQRYVIHSELMRLALWSVKNRVAANMLCILLILSGFGWAALQMNLSLFPEVTTNFIRIYTLDPETTSPLDVERLITIPIEQEARKIDFVKKVFSLSQENLSTIFLELDSAIKEVEPVVNEARQAVDKIRSDLPSSAETPVVENFELPFPLITFCVILPEGHDLHSIRENLIRLQRRLESCYGVSDVLVDGLENREIWIEWDPLQIQAYGINLENLSRAILIKNLNQIGGRLESISGEKNVKVFGEIVTSTDLGEIPPEGNGKVLIQHFANVRETSSVERTTSRVNLRRAVTFTLTKRKGADAIRTVKEAQKIFDSESKLLPPNYETQVVGDGTKYIKKRLDTVLQNGIQALILVVTALILLVNWRLALLVGIGIPISFAGTLIVLFISGQTINLLTMFGMIMALGMVVDDAIVVSENVYRLYCEGLSRVEAVLKGTSEVFWPVVGSVTTTIAAFLPLMLGEGILGKFVAVIPTVVISALGFSLVQAFLVLPSHLADFMKRNPSLATLERMLPTARNVLEKTIHVIRLHYAETRLLFEHGLQNTVQIYLSILKTSLRFRYLVFLCFVFLLLGTLALIKTGLIGFKLFFSDFADTISIKVDLPTNTSLLQTESVIQKLEKRILEVLPSTDIASLIARIGARLDITESYLEFGSNLATLTVDIDEQHPLCRKPSVIEKDLQRILREFPEFTRVTVRKQGGGPPVGMPVNVEISGADFSVLKDIASEIQNRLAKLPGIRNVANDLETSEVEWNLRVDPKRAAQLGLSTKDAAALVRASIDGLDIQTLRRGDEQVTVRLRLDERFRRDASSLLGLRVITLDGRNIALESFTNLEQNSSILRIKRKNSERVVTVSADLDSTLNTSRAVNQEISRWVPDILSGYPGYKISLTGENEDNENSLNSMKLAAVLALFLIYGILAALTNSFIQPLVIMVVIPFGIVGVCIGLIVMGQPLGLMSIMGTIALTGIVVNNSLLLVDFINRYYTIPGSKFSRWSALIRASRTRFRPIVLTVLTTTIGLLGLATTSTGQEQFLAPMAQSIVWGLCFATFLTLIFIPCLYAIVDDLRLIQRRKIFSFLPRNTKVFSVRLTSLNEARL